MRLKRVHVHVHVCGGMMCFGDTLDKKIMPLFCGLT